MPKMELVVLIGLVVLFGHFAPSFACEHILKADLSSQTLMSNNYPNTYDNDLNCSWEITTEKDSQIELKFFSFDTEPQYDQLMIYDGFNENAPVLKILQGKIHIPSPIISSTGMLFLRFSSDNSVTHKGFKARYRIALPSKVNITSIIQACLADTTVKNEVVNFDKVAREVEFKVVFPQQAYITRFFMEIDGVKYIGEIEKKERVKEIYEELEIKGISMGYVSSTRDLAKTFYTAIFLQPGKKAKFELQYQQLLTRRLGRYTNTVVLPREFLIHDLSIDIFLCARSNLTFLQIPPMAEAEKLSFFSQVRFLGRKDYFPPDVKHSKKGNVAHISYKSSGIGRTEPVSSLRSVFVLHYDVYRDNTGTLSVIGREYFATFFSPISGNLIRRIVFVLDVSGSMAGNKIEQVKIAMRNILNRLSRKDSFNIVQFESVIRTWKKKGLVKASEEAKRSARDYIESFDPEGKTNIHDALIKGINLLNQGTKITSKNRREDVNPYRDYIFFLGDGKPTIGVKNSKAILKAVQKANKKGFGINGIGFGKNVDVDFLQRLTRDNHGDWRIIYEDDDSHLQIQNFIAEIGVPTMTDISFEYSPNQVNFTTKRDQLVLVNGGEVGVFGRLLPNLTDEFLEVKITGRTFKKVKNEFRLPLHLSRTRCKFVDDELVDGFTERGYGIAKLQESLLKLKQATSEEENENATKEATDISLEFDLVSPLTFLVVRKPNSTRKEVEIDKEGDDLGKDKDLPGSIVEPLPGSSKPWVFEGDPHFIVALGKNVTICFTWNGTDGEVYNLLNDTANGIILNGLINYGPSSSHESNKSDCNDVSNDSTVNQLIDMDHLCNRDIESYFVELGFVFVKERIKIKVTPRLITIIDEKNRKNIKEETISVSDEDYYIIKEKIAISIYNMTTVHSFINVTLNNTVTFIINSKRGKNLPPDRRRRALIDHLDMDVVGHENLSPFSDGLFGIFPKNVERDFDSAKKSPYPVARLRRPGKQNLLLYRDNRIVVEPISIPDPYSKIPRQCWFTYEENLVTGRVDDAFRVDDIFSPERSELRTNLDL